MKLGEMLVRDGRLTVADLEQIISKQTSDGGRLGSLLVAAQLIDIETLTVYLGLEVGIPIATGATFERCKTSAVRLLSPAQAMRFHCIPIVIQGQTLIVAMDSPQNTQILDEIGRITGYRVIPRLAPEIRILFYLERFYGIPYPSNLAATANLGAPPHSAADLSLPPPPLPGLPPRVAEPKSNAMLRTSPQHPSTLNIGAIPKHIELLDTEGHETIEINSCDLVEDLESEDKDDTEFPAPACPTTKTNHAATLATPGSSGVLTPLSSLDAIKIISETKKRGDIGDAVLGHASKIFSLSTLLLVRDHMAFGWKGFGPGITSERIETLLVPLDPPSMFRIAIGHGRLYRARAFPSSLHSHWFRVLRSTTPSTSIVISCAIGNRIVNILYGQTDTGEDLDDAAMDGLTAVIRAASDAYVRLISKSKQSDQDQEQDRRASTSPHWGSSGSSATIEERAKNL